MRTQCAVVVVLLIATLGCACNAASVDYRVGAYYYPWYGNNNFHGGPNTCLRQHLVPTQQPELGWYNDRNASVVSQHFRWAKSAGIDFFITSYWGKLGEEDWVIRNMLFPNPDRGNIKIAVFLENSITLSKIATEATYLCDNYFSNSAYYKIDGKPVVYIYLTLFMSDADLATYTNTIRNTARTKGIGEVYLVGDEVFFDSSTSSVYRVSLLDAITGYDVYGSLHWFFGVDNYASQTQVDNWTVQRQGWKALADAAGRAFIPVVSPGFNDTAVRDTCPQGACHPPLSRKLGDEQGSPGSLFTALIQAALPTSNCNSIVVTSWNEWHEDTQIEPVAAAAPTNVVDGLGIALTDDVYYEGYGNLYLEILRDLTSTIPNTPTNTGATSLSPTSIRFTWQDNSANESGFKVYSDPGANQPTTLKTTTPANTNYYDLTGLTANAQYSSQVLATSAGGDGFRTPTLSAYTLASPPAVGSSIACDKLTNHAYPMGTTLTFTNPAGFGAGGANKVSRFGYAFDTVATHAWTGSEPSWSSGNFVRRPTLSGDYYLHLQSFNVAGTANPSTLDFGPFRLDGTAPTTTATPAGGAYDTAVSVTLSADEPATIYYTTNGADPTSSSSVYSAPIPINADTTLKFYAVDTIGNSELPKKSQVYWRVTQSGSIAAAKLLGSGDMVRLGAKHLYIARNGFGYVQEPDRSNGIRVQSGTLPPADSAVCLVGTLQKPAGAECYILGTAVTQSGPAVVRSLGANNTSLGWGLMSGLYVTVWGIVRPGSVTSNSFVIDDGSGGAGLRVSTANAPVVLEGHFAIVAGAVGNDGSRVIYARTVVQ